MQHTPGPWEMVSLSGYGSPFSIRMAYVSTNPEASKTYYGVQSVHRREDARLIAAAPELLASLKEALHGLEHGQHTIKGEARYRRAVAAIAKAEGREA